MRYAALILGGLMAASLPADARAQSARRGIPGQLRGRERRAPALCERRQGAARPVPPRLPVLLVPVEGSDGGNGPRPPGRRPRHARLQPVVEAGRPRALHDEASRRGRAAVRREDRREGQEVRAGRPRLGRQRRLGLRHVSPGDAGEARSSSTAPIRSSPNGSYARIPPSVTPATTSSCSTATWRRASSRSTRAHTRESAVRRAHAGFVDAEVKSGRYTEEDRQAWIEAWSQPGSTTAGLNYYRANHRNRAVQRSSSGVDDSPFLVGEGSHRGREVDDHQGADARDLGDEGHGDPVRSSQRAGQVGDQSERQAVSRR